MPLFKPAYVFALAFSSASILGCSDDPSPAEYPGLATPTPSFDVTGKWKGEAKDDDSALKLTVTFDNNGGDMGRKLSGKVEIEGLAISPLTFADSYIDMSEGASRILELEGADKDGFKWSLRGHVTSKRMDDGQFESDNPIADVDSVFLKTSLVKE